MPKEPVKINQQREPIRPSEMRKLELDNLLMQIRLMELSTKEKIESIKQQFNKKFWTTCMELDLNPEKYMYDPNTGTIIDAPEENPKK